MARTPLSKSWFLQYVSAILFFGGAIAALQFCLHLDLDEPANGQGDGPILARPVRIRSPHEFPSDPSIQLVAADDDDLLIGNPYYQSESAPPAKELRRLPATKRPRLEPTQSTISESSQGSVPSRSAGSGDDLLQGNPYYESAEPQRLPATKKRPQKSPPVSRSGGQVSDRAEIRGDDLLEDNPYHQTDRNSDYQPVSPNEEEVDDALDASESERSDPAAPAKESGTKETSREDLFGGLYDDIEEDKSEKEQKRKERGEDKDEAEKKKRKLDPHLELFAKNMYPSAKECAKCHEQIYKEWSVSSHAYAAVSPMFHRFEQQINNLSQGTVGYFCLRCHSPVGTEMGLPRDEPLIENIPAAYEGVTCIVCHRVSERYARVNGERRIETGSIFNPIYGGSDGAGLRHVISKKDHYKVKTSPDDEGPGQEIHTESIFFDQLKKSEYCVSCHQVAVAPGIKLEVVWEQYRASPACKSGISCQDCHMGRVPGKPLGYATAPGAVVGGKQVNPGRKHANHMFYGPGYSVAHPGIFPFNLKADEYEWKPAEWIQFDYRAGWGTEKFEEAVEDKKVNVSFPEAWKDSEDRRDAWDLIAQNLNAMAMEKTVRKQLMENSSHVDGPYFEKQPRCGKPLRFHYKVSNLNSGHNAPSGSLGAQPQIWVNAVLINPRGQRVWESGYTDAIGDVADTLSLEVQAGRCKPDLQLVNFQSKFLFTGVKGTDREWFLPVGFDIDQLPFIRPSGFPVTTLNHPPTIRMEQRSLPPLSTRKAKYRVPASAMRMAGKYRLSVRMRSRSHPIYFVRYCEGTPDMERRINEGMLDFHEDSVEFLVR